MRIWFATNNAHKRKELEAILKRNLEIPSCHGLEFNPDETGNTFFENAYIKAYELKKILNKNNDYENDCVIADDSGLCVDGLDGRPGVLSARYGEVNGKKLSSMEQNLLLLDELGSNPIRSARFVCCMVLMFSKDRFFVAQETIEGEIVKSKDDIKGDGGFGYDPIFYISEYGKTLAELSDSQKNDISHRGKAGRIISNILASN